jgi:hypothetical protein
MVHNGHIVLTTRGGAKAKNYDCGRFGDVPLDEIQQRMEALRGDPFVRLVVTGDSDDKRMVGITTSGFQVPADVAEMVYNDWILIDRIHGEGAYESVLNADERQVLALVKRLQFNVPVMQ